ncbi:ImmA/IrrE family metallo-endopeptidase [Candidatus Poribacteria bacterium]|nr:ImmA/IrrE family metallo-endopeptidase [Candidatus Poribacteria bacterium]MYF23334.1 ImmA/IrrE family metallo-endopeptidase [Chloroflexota bacterium]
MPTRSLDSIDPRALGRRLQEARKSRGLTQQQAADALSLARTTITAVEKGERRTRAEEIVQLANLYGRRVNELLAPREPLPDFGVQFRTAMARPGSSLIQDQADQAVSDFQHLCEDYRQLERLAGVVSVPSYPGQYPIEGIPVEYAAQDIASSERNRLGLGDGPLLRLRELLEEDVGLRAFSIDLPSKIAGLFAYTDELGGCIAINARHPVERRRWTLAHEYGHFLTSRYQSEISVLGTYERIPASERLADAFAGCFLMPESGLRRRFSEHSRSTGGSFTAAEVCRMAHYYAVSVEAMMRRLEQVGVLPRGTWERLRDRGFKVRDAQRQLGLVPQVTHERSMPARYEFLAVQAFQAGELSEGELARFLRTDRVSARQTVRRLTNAILLLNEGEIASVPIDMSSDILRREA